MAVGSIYHFRRHKKRSPCDLCVDFVFRMLYNSNPEVDKADLAILLRVDDVLRFDIAMAYPKSMDVRKGLE